MPLKKKRVMLAIDIIISLDILIKKIIYSLHQSISQMTEPPASHSVLIKLINQVHHDRIQKLITFNLRRLMGFYNH